MKKWVKVDDVWELHVEIFNEDEILIKFIQDEKDKDIFWVASEFFGIEQDCYCCESEQDAKSECEYKVISYLENEIEYHETILDEVVDGVCI